MARNDSLSSEKHAAKIIIVMIKLNLEQALGGGINIISLPRTISAF